MTGIVRRSVLLLLYVEQFRISDELFAYLIAMFARHLPPLDPYHYVLRGNVIK